MRVSILAAALAAFLSAGAARAADYVVSPTGSDTASGLVGCALADDPAGAQLGEAG